jgi:hypothetical protein
VLPQCADTVTALTSGPEHADKHKDRPDQETHASHSLILRGRQRPVKTIGRSSKSSGDLATLLLLAASGREAEQLLYLSGCVAPTAP